MKLRYPHDNWDYGEIGERVQIGNNIFHVGDVCEISHNREISQHIVVNKQEEGSNNRHAFFMGMGELMPNEKIIKVVKPFNKIKIDEEYNYLQVCSQ